jgi:16S rRNA (guanine527-N7)-methyltransferase
LLETQDRFRRYRELLEKWQEAINLVSRGTLSDAEVRHFQDSAQIADYIEARSVVFDFGSGAGFPGLVLALIRPD